MVARGYLSLLPIFVLCNYFIIVLYMLLFEVFAIHTTNPFNYLVISLLINHQFTQKFKQEDKAKF